MSNDREQKTEAQLKELLDSYREGLQHWQQQLSSSADSLSEIKLSKVDDPIDELVKLCQIIHANTTKMGLIFTKPLKDVTAAYNQTRDISSASVLFISLCVQLTDNKSNDDSKKFSKLFIDEILIVVRNLLKSLELFVTGLSEGISLTTKTAKDDDDTDEINDDDDDDGRLMSVGKIWDSVDQLIKISKMGKMGVLKLKLKESTNMIADGIEDLNGWIEDPSGNDDDDPFAFSDTDDEKEEEPIPTLTKDVESEQEEDDEDDYNDILPLAKNYLMKIKLVKLLLSSLLKSAPNEIGDDKVDEIFNVAKQVNADVDELICNIIFDTDLQGARVWFDKLSGLCERLISILKLINAKDDKKLKWVSSWQLKFKEEI